MTTRQPQAPGVGKTAKRHDLKTPATPGLTDSDLQQGDVQRLEAAQKVAPIKKGKTSSGGKQADQRVRGTAGGIEVPDAIDFAGQRRGQEIGSGQSGEVLDMSQWLPLLQQLARLPKKSGPLGTALLAQLSNITNTPSAGRVRVVDENAIQDAILQSAS